MRITERSEYRDQDGSISLENRVRGTLDYGLGWFGEMEAELVLTERLGPYLDDSYMLLRNAKLPGTDLRIPLILLGPQGVRTILPSGKKGVFRAKGENWYTFNTRSRRFKRTRPNLLSLSTSYAQALHTYLQSQSVPLPEVEPVLAFTNPRTHIDTAQPEVRIIQADAFERFANNLQKFQPIMDREDVDELTDLIIHPPMPEPEPEPAAEAEPTPESEQPISRAPDPSELDAFRLDDSPAVRRRQTPLGFTRAQWLVLGLLFLMELLIVIVFAAVIYSNSLF
ncbi:MAG: hypothetical protein WBR18_15405 [Anaerolineales bacterium]